MKRKKQTPEKLAPEASRPYMPGYGLPRDKKGLLPWKWADQRLAKSHNHWVATGRPDGTPHLMIVWGLWIEGAFYVSTGRQSRKAKNLALRPQCVVATEDAAKAVIVEGAAEKVSDVTFLRGLLKLYEKKYKYDMSAMEKDILSLKEPIYRVRPSRVFALDEKKGINAASRWRF